MPPASPVRGKGVEVDKILEDRRTIVGIYWNNEEGEHVRVGNFGYTRIVAYGECGMCCDIPWLAVYKGDELISRVPAWQVQIQYALATLEPPHDRE